MDVQWWNHHIAEVREKFLGMRYSSSNLVKKHGVEFVGKQGCEWTPHGNSGAGCVALAAAWGASKIIMLGYDCQRTNGMAHWHGDHPKGLGNAGAIPRWAGQFEGLRRKWADKSDIVNCSRHTALTCFRRGELSEELTA